MLGEEIRRRLHSGERVYGTHVTQTSNLVAARMLCAAGLDFAFICTEHMALDRAETSALCSLYAGEGVSPVVRIPYPSGAEAAMALDAGAQGIVAPYVETVEQVREIVGAVRFRPLKGKLLADLLEGRTTPSPEIRAFLDRFNRHTFAIIGIESVPAAEALDDLISVPGVDGVFIGPHDMSVSLGAPEQWTSPELHRVIEQIVLGCRERHVGVGAHLAPDLFSFAEMRRLVESGMNWILDGSDVGHAIRGLRERRKDLGLDGS